MYLKNSNIIKKALNILLVTKKMKLLHHYVLFYLKWMRTSNALKTGLKTCLFWLKMRKYGKNTIKFGMWLKINKLVFHSQPVYEYKYLKAKVREFNSKIKTNFLGNEVPKENIQYTCIACITIGSVIRIDKKIIHKFI